MWSELKDRLKGEVVVLGVGNRMRGDDAAGSVLAERLGRRVAVPVIDGGETPEECTGKLKAAQPDTVLVLDAVDFGAEAGACALIRAEGLGRATGVSTHSPPLSILAKYLHAETGADFVFLGIQPRNRGVGGSLSEQVSRTLAVAEEALVDILGAQRKMD